MGTLNAGNSNIGSLNSFPNVSNNNPANNLAKWRLALAKVRDGTANARILCVGDSTTHGDGTTNATTYPTHGSYPTRLAAMLNSYYAPAIDGLLIPYSNFVTSYDARWTLGTGWSGANFGAANGACFTGTSPSGNLVVTPGVNADRYYVYYLGNTGLGTITATATGGSGTPISTNLAQGIYRTLISAGSASSSNTVTMSGSGACYVVGVEPYLSTASNILVGNAGVDAATTTQWTNNPSSFGGAPFIKTAAPDLTIIALGINDAGNSATAATFSTNMQALITAAQVSGDVILTDYPISSDSAPAPALELSYLPYITQLAVKNNCTYLSIAGRFNNVNPGANWMYDLVHFNDDGYFDWASLIASYLKTI